MSRTKKPEQPASMSVPSTNGVQGDVLNLSEAAAYLRFSETDVVRLVYEQGLPGRQLGTEWRFLRDAIQNWLATGSPTVESRKAALLAAAGAFKDDPDLVQIVEDVYRKRGRPITEDGSFNLLHGLDPEASQK
jgi:excisionase family DNA binding protein